MSTVGRYHLTLLDDAGQPMCGCQPPAPDECCLYPYPFTVDPETPNYPATDLPATIVVVWDGVEYLFTYAGDFVYIGDLDTGGGLASHRITSEHPSLAQWFLRTNEEVWIGVAQGNCLIGPWEAFGGLNTMDVVDQFSETYVVSFPPAEYTVTRVSLCRWESANGLTWLEFVSDIGIGWSLHIEEAALEFQKSGDASSPVGTYADGALGEATVS